jgi:hypothetical protein
MTSRLTDADAYFVERFVGYTRGNLNLFSHESMRDLVVYECGYDAEAWDQTSDLTKGPRLRRVITTAGPGVQCKIVRSILDRCPEYGDMDVPGRAEARPKLKEMVARLEGVQSTPLHASASDRSAQALADAEVLVAQRGPAAGLDRLHTAIHDYLLAEARAVGARFSGRPGLEEAFGMLRRSHPALQVQEPWQEEIVSVLRGLAKVLEGLNSVRNNFSRVHPNDPLPDPEARLCVDASRAFLNYLNQLTS